MSLPIFSSTTTADEVAAVFATEIQGKNGELLDRISGCIDV
jgi:hypothetical protein